VAALRADAARAREIERTTPMTAKRANGAGAEAASGPAGAPVPPGERAAGQGAADTGQAGSPGPHRDPDAVRRFIERLASVLGEAGFPRMPARVFAGLLASDPGRLNAAELAELLQVSPAAVSGSVRYLSQVGLVSRESEPGSRRVSYRVPDDVWDQVLRLRDQVMHRLIATMREGVEVLDAGSAAGHRLTESIRYFEFVGAELAHLVELWRNPQAPAGDA
jgi:DNA-binding transcriptional regulator GbsR (MarR family)